MYNFYSSTQLQLIYVLNFVEVIKGPLEKKNDINLLKYFAIIFMKWNLVVTVWDNHHLPID